MRSKFHQNMPAKNALQTKNKGGRFPPPLVATTYCVYFVIGFPGNYSTVKTIRPPPLVWVFRKFA